MTTNNILSPSLKAKRFSPTHSLSRRGSVQERPLSISPYVGPPHGQEDTTFVHDSDDGSFPSASLSPVAVLPSQHLPRLSHPRSPGRQQSPIRHQTSINPTSPGRSHSPARQQSLLRDDETDPGHLSADDSATMLQMREHWRAVQIELTGVRQQVLDLSLSPEDRTWCQVVLHGLQQQEATLQANIMRLESMRDPHLERHATLVDRHIAFVRDYWSKLA